MLSSLRRNQEHVTLDCYPSKGAGRGERFHLLAIDWFDSWFPCSQLHYLFSVFLLAFPGEEQDIEYQSDSERWIYTSTVYVSS